MNPANKKSQNAKLEQFKEEIQALEAKYQYKLSAIIIYTQNGILPRLNVTDTIPPKESAAPAPAADPAPAVETPAEQPAEPESPDETVTSEPKKQ